MIDLRATAIAGAVMGIALIALFPHRLARGEDVTPYAQVAAAGAVAYLAALGWLRFRS